MRNDGTTPPAKAPEEAILAGHLERTQLATEFGVSPRTIDRWCDQPDGLPFVQLGRRKLFKAASVRKWLAGRERQKNTRRQRRAA